MELNIQEWKEFYLENIFETNIAKSIDYGNTEKGQNVFVGRTSTNNGVQGYVANSPVEKGNCITIGMVGENWAFYQPAPFVASQNILVLRNEYLNPINAMFLCSILNKSVEIYRKTYALPLSKEKMNKRILKLPVQHDTEGIPIIDKTHQYSEEGYLPDWQFMEDFIKSLNYKPITTKINNNNFELNLESWEWFSLGKLFDIKKGKRLTSYEQEEGSNNYIGAIDSNNGIANRIGQSPIHEANTISLSYNGSVGEAFYQRDPYWATDDVNALYSKYPGFNAKIGLFIATVIRQEKYKFSYGRKWTLENMKTSNIKLPIQRDDYGNPVFDNNKTFSNKGYIPNWQFMEDYINSLPYSDRI